MRPAHWQTVSKPYFSEWPVRAGEFSIESGRGNARACPLPCAIRGNAMVDCNRDQACLAAFAGVKPNTSAPQAYPLRLPVVSVGAQ